MTVATSTPPSQFFVACAMNFPRCFHNATAACQAVVSTACACHVAREAAAAILPKVTIKDEAATVPQGSVTHG